MHVKWDFINLWLFFSSRFSLHKNHTGLCKILKFTARGTDWKKKNHVRFKYIIKSKNALWNCEIDNGEDVGSSEKYVRIKIIRSLILKGKLNFPLEARKDYAMKSVCNKQNLRLQCKYSRVLVVLLYTRLCNTLYGKIRAKTQIH